jgi:TonB-linked SusC/RagA family outer membrane protein
MKKFVLLGLAAILTFSFSYAQDRTVSGKVTSAEDGSAVPGVNVVVKGTTTGTVTDLDGNYKLTVPASGGILQFSFIGLQSQEVEIGSRSVIDVAMASDVEQLSEVVVTGYGVEQKRDLTGSIATVDESVLDAVPIQSFDRALQGRAAGVQVQAASGAPGGGVRIVIRGQGSLSNNEPLYIVDGVQVNSGGVNGGGSNNALAGINPDDIASIEILKDAAAAAIYGAQSANGVVIVTTKSGQAGKSNIQVDFQYGVVAPLELYDVMNAQQFAAIKEEAYVNAGLDPANAYAQFGNPNEASSFTPEDWVDLMFRNAQLYKGNIKITGGNKDTQYYMAASVEGQEGQIIQSDWSRQNLRLNLTHTQNEKLKINTNISLSRQHNFGSIANGNFVNGPFQSAFVSQPNSPALAPDGSYNTYPAHLATTGAGHNFNYNILQGVNEERRESNTAQTTSSLKVGYDILPSLNVSVFGGLDYIYSQYINERPATIPAFAGFGGQTFYQNNQYFNWNANAVASFNEEFGDHNVGVIVGGELFSNEVEQNTSTKRGFPNPALRLPSAGATNFAITGTLTGYTRAGWFGKASYNYKNKYYINGTLRQDAHSRFGAANRTGTFYSVGASYRIIEESFMQGATSWLDDLKLRFSIGELGNANGIGNFEAISSFVAQGQYLGAGGQRLVLANDGLGWERSNQMNIGIDVGFLGNRIFASFDAFNNETKDQLFNVPLTDDSGFGIITANTGSVRNRGIEMELNTVNVTAGAFEWRSAFNLTYVENEVVELPNGDSTLGPGLLTVGQPINYFYGVDYAGVNPANGKPMWIAADGTYKYGNMAVEDAYYLGSPIPKWYGGLNNTLTWKGLTFDFFFQWQLDAQAFNGDLYNLAASGSFPDNQLVSQLERWQNPGDVTNVPKAIEGGSIDGYDIQFPGQTPSRYISDAGYVRLKSISLSYDLPKSFIGKAGFEAIRVYVQAFNMLTWTKFDGIDPEVVLQNNDVGASSYGVYPVGKQISGGISLTL